MKRHPQAKDIPDVELLSFVEGGGVSSLPGYIGKRTSLSLWDDRLASRWPVKVTQAKFAKLIKRGLVDGCACGCNGSFRLTADGISWLAYLKKTGPQQFRPAPAP